MPKETYQVAANEALFNAWTAMGRKIAEFRTIIQNDITLTEDDLRAWMVRWDAVIGELEALSIQTIRTVRKVKV